MKRENLIELKNNNRDNITIVNLINTIIGELDTEIGRLKQKDLENFNESEKIISILTKFYKNNMETLLIIEVDSDNAKTLTSENMFIEPFLPKMLNKEEIIDIIKKLASENGGVQIPTVMKYLSQNYKGQFDGKMVKDIINNIIN